MSSLKEPRIVDTKGWNIDCTQLLIPEQEVLHPSFINDELIESPDEQYAFFLYRITEYRIGAQAALLAIYKNKQAPILLANPKDRLFNYGGKTRSVNIFDDIIFLRMLAYSDDERLSGTPFVIFDLKQNVFAFIDFNYSSIYYSPVKISDTTFKFCIDKAFENYKNLSPVRHNEMFDISVLNSYPMALANNLLALYRKEKAA